MKALTESGVPRAAETPPATPAVVCGLIAERRQKVVRVDATREEEFNMRGIDQGKHFQYFRMKSKVCVPFNVDSFHAEHLLCDTGERRASAKIKMICCRL